MKVAIYIRTSTHDQNSELQHRELKAFCESRGWQDYEVYEDIASGANTQRPNHRRLLDDAKKRKVDIVMTWRLDRWARSLKQVITTLEELEDLGVKFISYKDNLDMTTASGRLMLQIIAAFGEFERNIIRERVVAGVANARAKGKRLGRPIKYDPIRIRQLRLEGKSYSQIGAEIGAPATVISRALKYDSPNKSL